MIMKKIFTLCAMMVAFIAGTTLANAQSKIPGELDLSTTTVEQGDGPELHGSAGWNGSNIDWMQTGQRAIINFENTKAGTKYNIISYAGTPNTGVMVEFKITAADGSVFYQQIATYVAGGWGDATKNETLPTTEAMPAGNYTLTLTYNNPEGNTTVNIRKIEFVDADAQQGGEDPVSQLGLNIPGILDGQKAVITKNCSWGSTPSCDDTNCFNWVGDGDVVTFAITNTKTSAYAISFDTATPCEPVTIDFLITDANGQTVYGQTANVVCTGENGGDWAFKPEGHNTSLPNTDVLSVGNYTLKLTFHQGTNYENFTTNLKDITFEAVGSSTGSGNFVFLHGENFDKENSNNDLYQFTDAQGFTLTMNNRDINKTPCNWTDPNGNAYTDGINFKNNDPGTINIPEGYKVTKLEIGGCSQSDAGNLCYLYTVDKDDVNFFTEAIGQNIKENSDIQSKATYPILADGTAPLFATLDFGAAPATKSIKVVFSGNNQENVWFKIYYNNGSEPAEDTKILYTWAGAEGTAAEVGGKAVASDGESVNYKNTANSVDYWTMRLNGANDFSTNVIDITLDSELAAGDKIAITAYRNKNAADKMSGAKIKFDKGGEVSTAGTGLEFVNLNPDNGGDQNVGTEPNTVVLDVPAEAAGSKVMTLTRAVTQTNLFITKIEITRGGTTGITEIAKSQKPKADGQLYNLRGQRVDASYKGIVIMNGKKFVNK